MYGHRFIPFPILLFLSIAASFIARGQSIYTLGGNGTNQNQYNLNNQLASCVGIPYPHGINISNGNLYLTVSNSIRRINLADGSIWTVAGSDTYGHTGDGGPATAATLQFPFDVCVDNNNNLYITEYSGNCIRKINLLTGIISTVAGTGAEGFSGDGGLAVNCTMNKPHGLACDAAGNIYFADGYNARIRKIDPVTGIITTVAGNGVHSYSGDGGLAVNAGVPYPQDVSIGPGGDIYFIETMSGNSCRVRKINAVTGIITTVAGNSNYAHSGDGGPATAASIFDPSGLVVDGAGNIYISQYDDSRIRKVDAATGIINTIAGKGVNGFAGDGGAAINAILHYPVGLCLNNTGDLFVADNFNHRIRKIGAELTLLPPLGPTVTISSSSTSACTGAPITFTTTISNSGIPGVTPVSFSWLVNGVVVSNSPSPFITSTLKSGDVVTCKVLVQACNSTYFIISNAITMSGGPTNPPLISISANDTTVCSGEQVNFTAITQNAGANPTYQWKLNGTNVGANSITFSSSTLVNGDKISCTVISDPAASCGISLSADAAPITMIVSAVISPTISVVTSGNDVCAGEAITFNASVQNGGASPAYQWKLNGVAIGTNNPFFTYSNFKNNDIVVCEINPGTGVCSGTVSSAPEKITIKPPPIILINPADTIVSKGAQVMLKATIAGGANSFQWSPANQLTDPNSLNPITVPMKENAVFELSVEGSNGCTGIARSKINIVTKFAMPSAFTPNNDRVNDTYRIPAGAQMTLHEFSIYDRWGNRVFQTRDLTKGWDGTFKGVRISNGGFVFIIRGVDDNGPVFLKGSFLLLR